MDSTLQILKRLGESGVPFVLIGQMAATVEVDLDGIQCHVLDLDTLIESKCLTDRHKNERVASELEYIRKLRDEGKA